jgi:hypothetical protein
MPGQKYVEQSREVVGRSRFYVRVLDHSGSALVYQAVRATETKHRCS